VLVACVAPKLDPVIVTTVPTGPEEGFTFVIVGDGVTVKLTPLLGKDPTVTTTLPVVAPVGTEIPMLVSLQLTGAVGMPLNEMELNPFEAPKLLPLIVTEVPTGPDEGLKLVIAGATPKFGVLLARPPTVTTTLAGPAMTPVGTGTTMLVELQLVGVALTFAKVTVLVPCVAPKLVPVIVTKVPTGPEAGDRLAMPGVTVKFTPLLARALTLTTTFPVMAPTGTGTTMLVALQLVGVAAVPLNVTVLVP